jgi:hypothetical protein
MKKYIFEDYPKKKSINFYNEKRKIIKKFFQNDNNLLSVYEYGKTKAPGISDLDIILIFKDNLKTKNLNKKKYDLINIDSELYDLVKFGNVIKMGLNTFNNIQYFDKFNLKNIVGKKIKTLIPTNNEIEVIKQISINDWIP